MGELLPEQLSCVPDSEKLSESLASLIFGSLLTSPNFVILGYILRVWYLVLMIL